MNIRLLEKTDIIAIVTAFENSGWQIKPESIFEQRRFTSEVQLS